MLGEILHLDRAQASRLELLLCKYARTAWPWLTAEAQESFQEFSQPDDGSRARDEYWVLAISEFEGTEQGRLFKFNRPAKDRFEKWVSAKRRKTDDQRKVNQKQRLAFGRMCNRLFCHLSAR